MYKSPIEITVSEVMNEFVRKQDEQILKAVQNVGVNVNEKELRKALIYDRQQYNKGYRDGIREFAERLKGTFPSYDVLRFTERIKIDIDDLVEEMAGDNNG